MILSLFLCTLLSAGIESATFDQSQTGSLNVQVDLKDLQIFALMKGGKQEEYVDYDYAYDYSEMTIKPQNGTTPKPLNVTINSNSSTVVQTYNATEPTALVNESTTTTFQNMNISDFESTTRTLTELMGTENKTSLAVHTMNATNSTMLNVTSTSSGDCKKGFTLNQKGDCELNIQASSTNALLKLVKLSQKLKLRRERKNSTSRGG